MREREREREEREGEREEREGERETERRTTTISAVLVEILY